MSEDTEKGFFGKLLDKAKKSKAEADKKLQIQKEESKRRENLFQNETNLIHASIDTTNRLWKSNGWIYSFDEVTQYDLIVDGEAIASGMLGDNTFVTQNQ